MKMTESEKKLYLEGSSGLAPYLRMQDKGMPQGKVNQIAWLLLNGSGCGFCKVCRDEPCNIKDGEKCTTNIANYIREIVKAEQQPKTDWIPCEVDMPKKEYGTYWIAVEKEGCPYLHYCSAVYTSKDGFRTMDIEANGKIVAWRPIRPYKKEGNSNENT